MKAKTLLFTLALFSPFCLMAATAPEGKDCPACPTGPTDPEKWISFLPVILFLLILFITTIKLRNDKTKLSDLLVDKDVPTTPPTGGAAGVAPVVGAAPAATPTPSQSVSRFIAFLTGLTALSIGVCISTFYMYCYFGNPGKTIDISNLTNVIWGLGIGVIPYGANKVSSAMKSNA
jgi:hypothetical protein